MAQSKPKKSRAKQDPSKGIEHFLSEQTTVILHAVDERLSAQDKKFEACFDAIDRRFDAVDKRNALEQRFMEKLNSLTRAPSITFSNA